MSNQPIEMGSKLPSDEKWAQGSLLGDEWANCLTHALGLILSLIGMILLIMEPFQMGDYWKMAILGIYGGSLILLYTASTLYHAVSRPEIKQLCRTIDHCAIYLLIAGSYTPFTLLVIGGMWGWALLITVWGLAFFGMIFKIFFRHRFAILSTCIYLFMGWLVVIAAEPLIENIHPDGLFWLIAGGLSYTFGVIFFALDNRRFFHAIWHLFVLGGSICHYIALFVGL